jgi:glycine/D-amino acid oxidase-like deaminating enzyme
VCALQVPAGTRTGPSAELTAALHALVENQCPNVGALCDWAQAVPWHGDRPLTPDCQPLVGRTRIPGLYVHAGHSFNGWRDATLSARVLGRAVSGEAHPRDDAPPSSDEAAIRLAARVYAPHRFQPWPPSQ